MVIEHVKAGLLMIAGTVSLIMGDMARTTADVSGEVTLIEKYIDKGGTTLGLVLCIVAVVYLVRENKSLKLFIGSLHEKQLEATSRSTEARLAQTNAVEHTNRVVGDLSEAVKKLADKVER